MNWLRIDQLIPARPRYVLLFAREPHSKQPHWQIGLLGGCQNAPELVITNLTGRSSVIRATHWAQLEAPEADFDTFTQGD